MSIFTRCRLSRVYPGGSLRGLLLVALPATIGCAGPAPHAPASPPPPPRNIATQRLPEDFNPEVLKDELLLVKPVMTREQVDARLFAHPAMGPPAPVDVPSPPVALPEPGNVPPQKYQVQVLALSQEQAAQEKRAELQNSLGVPVYVVPKRGLFLVRAGTCFTAEEARLLKLRIAALAPAYADAYVVSSPIVSASPARSQPQADLPPDSVAAAGSLSAPAPAEEVVPTVHMVRIFGWRVLLDKVQSYDKARQLKQRAADLLRRSDIDITFRAPWYNVELGQFRTEAQAQEALERIKGRFPNALEVRGRILVPAEN